MTQPLLQDAIDQIIQEERHFADAPQAFFEAWRRGVRIAGSQWFGDGTPEGLDLARSKWDLCPDVQRIDQALGVLSGGERMFLAAMVSIYNEHEGGAMLRRCGFQGLADFGALDSPRREVIAKLVLHYNGW